jgi:HK97 gp10 family phage protein
VNILGVEKTVAAFAEARAEMELAAPVATKASAGIIAQQMVSRAPRDTGATANSIEIQETETSGEGAVSRVGPGTSYARFTEYGTAYMPAQHWMLEAMDSSTSQIVATMTAIFSAAMRF